MKFTTSMSDALGKRVEAAFCETYQEEIRNPDHDPNYVYDPEGTAAEKPNPRMIKNVSKHQWACNCITEMIRSKVLQFEGSKAQNYAYQAKHKEVTGLVITTV